MEKSKQKNVFFQAYCMKITLDIIYLTYEKKSAGSAIAERQRPVLQINCLKQKLFHHTKVVLPVVFEIFEK